MRIRPEDDFEAAIIAVLGSCGCIFAFARCDPTGESGTYRRRNNRGLSSFGQAVVQ